MDIIFSFKLFHLGLSSIQLLSGVQLFETPLTVSCQASVNHQLLELAQTHIYHIGDAIQPSYPVITFSSCLQFFPASESFPTNQFTSGGQSIGTSDSASILPMDIRVDFL